MPVGKSLIIGGIALSLLALTGCKEDPAVYSKDKAAGRAMERLVRYADLHHIPVHQFHGPYIMESLGQDYPTYVVCFKNSSYFYCYDDWTNSEDSGAIPKKAKSGTVEWLKLQPD